MTEEAKYFKPCSTCHNNECAWTGTKDTHLICEDYKSLDGDYIRRQAVLDELTNIAKAKAKSDAQKSLMGRVMFLVEQMPSVQLKTGHWIKENPPMVERYPFCSKCGFVNPFENALNYCPGCGAKMEGTV